MVYYPDGAWSTGPEVPSTFLALAELGIILLPIGAALLVVAVFLIARAARPDSSDP